MKTTYTLLLIKLIIHIRYSVHAIHTPLRSETGTNHYALYFTV